MTAIQGPGYQVEEPLFGTLDYIPLVSTVSGVARAAFGYLEAVFGLIVFPIQLVQRVADCKNRYLFNIGVSNIVRGKIAAIPLLGNLAIYSYDHLPSTKSDLQNLFGLKVYQ